jgi:hypothetical protein
LEPSPVTDSLRYDGPSDITFSEEHSGVALFAPFLSESCYTVMNYRGLLILCCSFTHVIFSHCPMEANRAAHVFASRAGGFQFIVWQEDRPDFVFL